MMLCWFQGNKNLESICTKLEMQKTNGLNVNSNILNIDSKY